MKYLKIIKINEGGFIYDENAYSAAFLAKELPLYRLTVLIAPNGSGKTTILQLLHPIMNIIHSTDTEEIGLSSILYSSLRPYSGVSFGYSLINDEVFIGWSRLSLATPEIKRRSFRILSSNATNKAISFIEGFKNFLEELVTKIYRSIYRSKLNIDYIREALGTLSQEADALVPLPGSETGYRLKSRATRQIIHNTYVSILISRGKVIGTLVYYARGIPLMALINTKIKDEKIKDIISVLHYHPAIITHTVKTREAFKRGIHTLRPDISSFFELANELIPGFDGLTFLGKYDNEPFVQIRQNNAIRLIPLSSLGDGQRSSLLLALLASIADKKKWELAVDTPEAFMHPDLSNYIIKFFIKLLKNNRNIIIATQSLELLSDLLAETDKAIGLSSSIIHRMRLSRKSIDDTTVTNVFVESIDAESVLNAMEDYGIDIRLYESLVSNLS